MAEQSSAKSDSAQNPRITRCTSFYFGIGADFPSVRPHRRSRFAGRSGTRSGCSAKFSGSCGRALGPRHSRHSSCSKSSENRSVSKRIGNERLHRTCIGLLGGKASERPSTGGIELRCGQKPHPGRHRRAPPRMWFYQGKKKEITCCVHSPARPEWLRRTGGSGPAY